VKVLSQVRVVSISDSRIEKKKYVAENHNRVTSRADGGAKGAIDKLHIGGAREEKYDHDGGGKSNNAL